MVFLNKEMELMDMSGCMQIKLQRGGTFLYTARSAELWRRSR